MTVTIKAELRTITGNSVRTLAKEFMPAVAYSKEFGNLNIQVVFGEFVKAFRLAEGKMILDFGKEQLACTIKAMDINPLTDLPRHVDFMVDAGFDAKSEVAVKAAAGKVVKAEKAVKVAKAKKPVSKKK